MSVLHAYELYCGRNMEYIFPTMEMAGFASFTVLCNEPRALHMLGKCYSTGKIKEMLKNTIMQGH
jgi:hypothetical protein